MMSNSDSTTDADCRLDRPCAATALIRSFLVSALTSLRPSPCGALASLRGALRQESDVSFRLQLLARGERAPAIRVPPGAHNVEPASGRRADLARRADDDLESVVRQPL